MLADAFSQFIHASAQLEESYRDLQQEVAHLGSELAERNAALTESLAENDRIRVALQQILDSMPCGVLVLDLDECIVMINPEGRRLLQIGDARVHNLRELSAATSIDFEFLAATEQQMDHEICISSNENKHWLAIGNCRLQCDPGGKESQEHGASLQSVWILRDITSSKLAEADRESGRMSMALAETSMILAHEIRNPLASMELFAGLIAEDPSQTSLWVSNLRAGIRQLSGTVNNVLNIQSGGTPHLSPLTLCESLQRGVAFVQPIAEQAGVLLSFLGGDDWLKILGNENMIRQIVLNLVCNAIRHTPSSGAVCVSLHAERQNQFTVAVVEITDTGCGIPEHQIDHIFDVGFSVNGDTPGLGLAVCRRLMTQHGGTISVSSRVDCGTTFRLEFPTL
jgi:two-component system sensor histidine kinase FlrB